MSAWTCRALSARRPLPRQNPGRSQALALVRISPYSGTELNLSEDRLLKSTGSAPDCSRPERTWAGGTTISARERTLDNMFGAGPLRCGHSLRADPHMADRALTDAEKHERPIRWRKNSLMSSYWPC